MSVREPLKFRKAALAGAVALALTGTGVAIAWAADPSPPSSSAPGNSDKAQGHNKPDKAQGSNKADKAQRPQHLHGESVVKKADGTFVTELGQRGTVEAVSGTSVTVKSEDGYSQAYSVTAETKIAQVPPADSTPGMADGGKRPKRAAGSIADIATGDVVRISGVKSGDQVTAERIVEGGDRPGPGLGTGRGHGHGKGHSK
ncbi:hypothetical protein M8J71_05235 [Pseudarthrobacter sp. R1]|uniref:hypothetical protein n=1 Tax=Pseudarthrobacter sp. R1 TaxID=2944934 RepID=UPI0021087EB0|nr:hypothetical protein [Pseudarthrobacter sp. R1]MCQ6269888.1 hypothetical protein [Pseudarthrobacter sp. R1]